MSRHRQDKKQYPEEKIQWNTLGKEEDWFDDDAADLKEDDLSEDDVTLDDEDFDENFDLDITDEDIRAYDLLDDENPGDVLKRRGMEPRSTGEQDPKEQNPGRGNKKEGNKGRVSPDASWGDDQDILFLYHDENDFPKGHAEDDLADDEANGHSSDTGKKKTPEAQRKSRRRKHRAAFATLLAIVIAAVLAGCFFAGTGIQRIALCEEAESSYRTLASSYIRILSEDGSSDDYTMPEVSIDFEKLSEINSDFAGVLYIPSIDLLYPFLAGEDAETASAYTFEGERNPEGSVFLSSDTPADLSGLNTVIYGSQAPGRRLFGKLLRYRSDASLAANDPYIYIFTPTQSRKYRLMGWYRIMNNDPVLRQFDSERRYEYYISLTRSRSRFTAGDLRTYYNHQAPFLTLATYREGTRSYCFVVSAVLTHTQEEQEK